MKTDIVVAKKYVLRSWDLIVLIEALIFAVFSFLFPHTGKIVVLGYFIPRGWVYSCLSLLFALMACLAPLLDTIRIPKIIRFVRTFYPQALSAFFFTEAIMLSSQVFSGYSHDAFFMKMDGLTFGFQPALVFGPGFFDRVWLNELMFGSYFSYYALLAITPWIPWFTGKQKEAERQLFAFALFSGIFDIFYIFFRVQGPKYWVERLYSHGYDPFQGGLFVNFFKGLFKTTTLSGAAFPSSHVAESVLFCFLIARTDKRLLYLYIPATMLISVATVYIYAHWAVDVFGGLIFALLLYPFMIRAFDPLEAIGKNLGHSLPDRAFLSQEKTAVRESSKTAS